MERPFPKLLEAETGAPCVNLGCVNAGLDVFLNDQAVLDTCSQAQLTVIQVIGAHNLSNRYYAVHPRRNDRFLCASPLLQHLYSEIDFTEFHFTRHMLTSLLNLSATRFELIVAELQSAWISRMKTLAAKAHGKTLLLWLSDHQPEECDQTHGLGRDPLFVNRRMIEEIRGHVTEVVEIVPSAAALAEGTDGMVYSALEKPAAQAGIGPWVHREVAARLGPVMTRLGASQN